MPKGFAAETGTVDISLCRRVAMLARVPVPTVNFLLGGLAAAEIHHWSSLHIRDQSGHARRRREHPQEESCPHRANTRQFFIIDELDTACGEWAGHAAEGWPQTIGPVFGEHFRGLANAN